MRAPAPLAVTDAILGRRVDVLWVEDTTNIRKWYSGDGGETGSSRSGCRRLRRRPRDGGEPAGEEVALGQGTICVSGAAAVAIEFFLWKKSFVLLLLDGNE